MDLSISVIIIILRRVVYKILDREKTWFSLRELFDAPSLILFESKSAISLQTTSTSKQLASFGPRPFSMCCCRRQMPIVTCDWSVVPPHLAKPKKVTFCAQKVPKQVLLASKFLPGIDQPFSARPQIPIERSACFGCQRRRTGPFFPA